MRRVKRLPAEQLQSVARRYHAPRNSTAAAGSPSPLWHVLGPARRDSPAGGAEDPLVRRQRLETVLLLTREPLNSRKLAQHARLADGTEARTIVRQLNQLYDETGRAYRVEEVAGGFQLLTRRQFAPWLQRLEHVPPQIRLSGPAMETLAVVAYRQPVLRAEVEAIRGVNCGEILRQLMERELVRIGGRSDELGRPYLYTTTKRFLQLFGLHNLDDLPRAFAFRGSDGATEPETPESLSTAMSTDEARQEQEESEVSVTSPTQLPVDQLLKEMSSMTVLTPQASYDNDEYEEDDYEYEDDEEDEDDDEDEEEEEFADEDIAEDDGFEDDDWEEVEDDDEDESADTWEDDDEDWEDDDEEEEDWEDGFQEEEAEECDDEEDWD